MKRTGNEPDICNLQARIRFKLICDFRDCQSSIEEVRQWPMKCHIQVFELPEGWFVIDELVYCPKHEVIVRDKTL